ncbi:zinc ribbon domain-containing protein YjdM [Jeotgalicoccus meleagridis]|jgi:protein PhnA|uniref:Alkylphosphonate utilization protein n=1 Tax=Jeotgalicoccus meleagridis TaxID=2759181 RepID=A0A6V7R1R9_9STAP|nr:zinc ribbon domain-containing protein YjdM [Jeotgalicoccus meleagridis]CAD2071287.1 hypothetical protein JEODO184_00191 [Jeotgalicoccus meleagridis]
MENTLPACPSCGSEYTYEDGNLLVCPMCHHEWTREEEEENIEEDVKDAVGNVLSDGDTVTIIKDLKIKGSSNVIKQGTKVKNIRLIDPEDGHDLDCKIPGIGQMNLKSEFVKKI